MKVCTLVTAIAAACAAIVAFLQFVLIPFLPNVNLVICALGLLEMLGTRVYLFYLSRIYTPFVPLKQEVEISGWCVTASLVFVLVALLQAAYYMSSTMRASMPSDGATPALYPSKTLGVLWVLMVYLGIVTVAMWICHLSSIFARLITVARLYDDDIRNRLFEKAALGEVEAPPWLAQMEKFQDLKKTVQELLSQEGVDNALRDQIRDQIRRRLLRRD